jgi:DnaK suppressor protein
MEQVREILLQRWTKIGEAAHDSAEPEEGALSHSEVIDMAQTLEQIGRDTSLAEKERRELLAIERALSKMSSGQFGSCEQCAEDIPSRRLLALPEARLCARCQAFEERRDARARAP